MADEVISLVMGTLDEIKTSIMATLDFVEALVPRPVPTFERLKNVRFVAHRGSHDGPGGTVRENTLGAFDRAIELGAWGLEFDIRWTSDDVAVVHHDRDARRVFGSKLEISRTSFEELRRALPEIPTFDEVIARYQNRAHLMIELKRTEPSLTPSRLTKLENSLRTLRASQDYHLISLAPELLLKCEFAPHEACLPVTEVNVGHLSRIVLREKFGGLAGHYLLMTNETMARHHAAGQCVGTGFPSSRSVLFRELNRGVDWIFTNHLRELTAIVQAELETSAQH